MNLPPHAPRYALSLALLATTVNLPVGLVFAAESPATNTAAASATLSQAPRSMSETLALAASHPAIAARAAQVVAGQAGLGIAQAAQRPTVGVDVQGGVQRYDAGLGIRGTAPVGLGRLTLNQSVYDAGSRRADIAAADAHLAGAEGNLEWQRRQQIFAAAQAHIALWLAQQLAEADQQSLAALTAIDAATRQRRAQGDATITEVAEAASRVATARARLTAQQTALASARGTYLSAVGSPVAEVAPPTLPDLPAGLAFNPASLVTSATVPNVGNESFTPATQLLLANRVLQHPLLVAAAAQAQEAVASVSHQQAQAYPTVDLAGNAQHDAYGGLERNDNSNTGAVTLNLHYNLSQGGAVSAGISQAKALKKAADDDRESVALQLTAETNAACSRWLGAGQELTQQAVALAEARQVLGSLDAEIRQGNRTLRDLLDARRDEIDVLAAWLTAAAQQAQAGYDLQRWLGDDAIPPTPGLLAAQPVRPDLSPASTQILPGVAWPAQAPVKVATVTLSPTLPVSATAPSASIVGSLASPTLPVSTSLAELSPAAGPSAGPSAVPAISDTLADLPAIAELPSPTVQVSPSAHLAAAHKTTTPAAVHKTKKEKGLAVASSALSVPTLPAGLPALPAGSWLVYVGPAGTPLTVVSTTAAVSASTLASATEVTTLALPKTLP